MDEDDGLLLNFAVPDVSVSSGSNKRTTSKVTGGKWKDRRKLQLSLQGRGRNQKKDRSATGKDDGKKHENDESNDSKKRPTIEPIHGPTSKMIKFSESKGEFGGKNNSYVSSLFTSNQSSSQLKVTKESDEKTYLPSNAPVEDASTFEGLGINERLSKHLTETLRFKNPTKVQKSVIPTMLSTERDLFIKAQTGSGKTLSFLLPIFHKLMMENKHKINRDSGLFAVILTPTRELATQIYGVLETLTRCYHHIVPGIVIGGEKKKSEKARIRKGVNILVGTPGRLADHMENTESLDISQLRWLILDEGDKLVELGFEETITKITNLITRNSQIMESMHKWQGLPVRRINLLCSATMQNNVEKLGSIILNNPEMISDGSSSGKHSEEVTAPDQLIQNVVVVPPKLRLVTLSAILKKISSDMSGTNNSTRTIVFFSCSDSVNFHFDVFTRGGNTFKKVKNDESGKLETVEVENDTPLIGQGTAVYKLHGSLSQQTRTSTLQAFIKDSKSNHSILFCTDVASRGLDLPNIASVIEYDPPFTIDDHLHRIGRSARVGKEGTATLFLLPGNEEGYVDGKLQVVHPKEGNLRIVNYENYLKDGFSAKSNNEDTKKKSKDPKSREGKWDIHATTWHLDIERWLLEDSGAHDKAVQAFTSHIRAYATHLSSERNYFNVKLLHLGHLAKSFGLRETPKKLGKSVESNSGIQGASKKTKKEDPRKKMLRMAKMALKSNSDEFNYS
ncbi:ATP-dependent RNA helicase DBP7 (DEAD-box protein 7) [Scheffersomyces stipitis CBS 6054]|uniref:ATP-dependent RNA helicase DBP7 n=1 Tax=Scheffersomyces stipitis (strain ATCC 58785 / CBS 6054 / NBRC 10063 / NRRL Y-11545) TaxID=322104 RepID=DBP7_PICST|nr:ATP-dependent RNA helicase DBP7 (DEAD-box protein 7) [Scheffersomyces stipitis CBS 6054]A3LWH3.2 RecName: Full=ATP-dependent RNA helicase DBP7 [Scheffersomyces stipitis CBS 6054]ABN67277.2 ATP-dependent RNA helicase DBP7 (DEAD-box protein 7) [Scheffersomyces stipitis CBS 6054]